MNIKELKKEFKILLKTTKKIYKTAPIKFKENELNNLINRASEAMENIASSEESINYFKNKFKGVKSFTCYFLLKNERYFESLNKIVDFKDLDDKNIYSNSLFTFIAYHLNYNSISYPHIKKFIDECLIDNDEITKIQEKLIYEFSYWKYCYEQDLKDNKEIKVNVKELEYYLNFHKELDERKQKYENIKKEERETIEFEEYKKKVTDLNVKIGIDTQYRLAKPINYLTSFEDFTSRFGNYMPCDKSQNLEGFELLISKICSENNIYALSKYLVGVVSGNYKYVPLLDEVIKHMLTKVSYNLKTLEYHKVGTNCTYAAFCEFLLYQFGIVYEKDVNKARYLLLKNSHLIFTPLIHLRPYFGQYILKAIFQHYKDYKHFDAYEKILDYILDDLKINRSFYYDQETIRYLLDYAKEKNDSDFVGLLLNNLSSKKSTLFTEYNDLKEIYDKKIYEAEQKRLEELRIAQEIKEEKERLRQEDLDKRYKILYGDNIQIEDKYNNLSVEELSEMIDDAKAMYKVAMYYFKKGNKDKEQYLKAVEYFEKSVKAGSVFQKVNVGISYNNYSSSSEDEYAKLSQDAYREHAKTNSNFAFRFILSKYKYNPIEEIEKEEIFNIFKEKGTDYDKTLVRIAYSLYKGHIGDAFNDYLSIKYEIKNESILEKFFIEFLSQMNNNHFKLLMGFDHELFKYEVQMAYDLGIKRVGLYLALGYYKGNHNDFSLTESYTIANDRIYDRDLKKAYHLLDELIDEYAGNNKEYYVKIKEEIKEKLKKKGVSV